MLVDGVTSGPRNGHPAETSTSSAAWSKATAFSLAIACLSTSFHLNMWDSCRCLAKPILSWGHAGPRQAEHRQSQWRQWLQGHARAQGRPLTAVYARWAASLEIQKGLLEFRLDLKCTFRGVWSSRSSRISSCARWLRVRDRMASNEFCLGIF